MIAVDKTHVLFPRNTEYEIFSIGQQRHVLGAIFLLNHRTVFQDGMPPVHHIAEQAHREGALLDLDKHNWPWSLMLVPVAKVDLFELSNNSVWRTAFGFRATQVQPAPYMEVETDAGGMTEKGWLDFGFQTYYTLLDCGFRLQPTAGTASGVHPVPLGYSRVYVHVGQSFDGPTWLAGLRHGRSFVTTGPMLLATVAGKQPGEVFQQSQESAHVYRVAGTLASDRPAESIEVIVNGRVRQRLQPTNNRGDRGAWSSDFSVEIEIGETSWICVRAFQRQDDGRLRFAHTAPWHIEVGEQPIRPRAEEIAFLVGRMEDEIRRNTGVLPEPALDEFRQALSVYREIQARALPGEPRN
jgi:hypothetical protein